MYLYGFLELCYSKNKKTPDVQELKFSQIYFLNSIYRPDHRQIRRC